MSGRGSNGNSHGTSTCATLALSIFGSGVEVTCKSTSTASLLAGPGGRTGTGSGVTVFSGASNGACVACANKATLRLRLTVFTTQNLLQCDSFGPERDTCVPDLDF